MKVLIIHTSYMFKGGEDGVVSNEVDLLKSAGAEVELLLFSNKENTFLKILQLPFNFSSYFKTKKKIALFQPDIVHIHNLHFAGSPSVIYAVKKNKIPIVFTLHNYRLLCPSATLFFDGQLYTKSVHSIFCWDAIVKGVYQHSKILTFWMSCSMLFHQLINTWKLIDQYIALGEYTKEIFYRSKLNYITPHIVIKPNFCFAKPANDNFENKYYLYVGRLSEEKGINTLLQAFSENKLPLKIAGTGPLTDEVIQFCKNFPNIKYMGSVDQETVQALLKGTAALIFPSQWFEPFGMVIIEAFAQSIPVICSKIGQLESTVKNGYNGLHFETGSKKDLIKKISAYNNLSQKEKNSIKSNALQTFEEKYSPEKNKVKLINIYKHLIR